jgi:hypothetical protein
MGRKVPPHEKRRGGFPVIPERRGKMHVRNYLIVVLLAGLFLGFALQDDEKRPVADASYVVQPGPEVIYGQHIDRIIERGKQQCERLGDTRSGNLKADAKFMARKVEFCQQNRDELIQEMARADIPPSRNPVNHFIMKRFAGDGE